jgi:hypothetical protein
MSLTFVAIAASALMISDVRAARAATKFCDIYPERCQYGSNGVYYYYPLGYRMPGSTVAPTGAHKYTINRRKPVMTARQKPIAAIGEKPSGDGTESIRPGPNL